MIVDKSDQKNPLSHYIVKAEASKRLFDALTKGVSLVNSYFIISFLSVFHFGFYQLVLAFIELVKSASMQQFDGLVMNEMRRYFNVQKPSFAKRLFLENTAVRIGLAIVAAIVVFFGSELVAAYYSKDISLFIKLASVLLILDAAKSLMVGFLESVISFSYQSLATIREFIKLILIVGFVLFYQFAILEVMIAHVTAEAIALLLFAVFVFVKKYRYAFGKIKAHTEHLFIKFIKTHGSKIFLIYGLKGALGNIMPWLVKFLLSVEAVAFYTLAVNLVAFVQEFMPLSGVKPILALKVDNPADLSFVFRRAAKYTLWLGCLFFIVAFVAVPPVLTFIFPKYIPAIPAFLIMTAALPIYGMVRIVHYLLGLLREYGVIAMRIVNELLVVIIGSLIFLPTLGVMGTGVVYVARTAERLTFLYSQLIKRYPMFKIRPKDIFSWDTIDNQFIKKAWHQAIALVSRKKNQ